MEHSPLTPLYKILENSNLYLNCTQCSSQIEILSIDEENNNIEFKCSNIQHKKQTMKIKTYLDIMKSNTKKK